jgi:hypothetical protein
MSGGMGEGMCPLCNGKMLTSFETRPHDFVTGICLHCGYCFWTELGVADLRQVNAERKNEDLEPLTKLTIDLKGLDLLRLENGLELLREVPKNRRKALNRIKKEVTLQDVMKKE